MLLTTDDDSEATSVDVLYFLASHLMQFSALYYSVRYFYGTRQ